VWCELHCNLTERQWWPQATIRKPAAGYWRCGQFAGEHGRRADRDAAGTASNPRRVDWIVRCYLGSIRRVVALAAALVIARVGDPLPYFLRYAASS